MAFDFQVPQDRYYDARQHLWIQFEEKGQLARVGLDTLGLDALGDLAFVEIAAPGTRVSRGAAFGTLEAQKMTSPLIAPVSGAVVSHNPAVLRDPGLVNSDPYDHGWLVTIATSDWKLESQELIQGDGIGPWIEAEIARYRAEGGVE